MSHADACADARNLYPNFRVPTQAILLFSSLSSVMDASVEVAVAPDADANTAAGTGTPVGTVNTGWLSKIKNAASAALTAVKNIAEAVYLAVRTWVKSHAGQIAVTITGMALTAVACLAPALILPVVVAGATIGVVLMMGKRNKVRETLHKISDKASQTKQGALRFGAVLLVHSVVTSVVFLFGIYKVVSHLSDINGKIQPMIQQPPQDEL